MTLRRKLLLSQLPLLIALVVTAAGSLYAAVRFGSAPSDILYQNFRSFDAGRSMLRATNAIDQRVLSASFEGRPFAAAEVSADLASFDRELRLQESNITEKGERAATATLRRDFEAYRASLADATRPSGVAIERRRSLELRSAVDRILVINRDAMRHKSALARTTAQHIGIALAITAAVAFVLAVLVAGTWLRRALGPLRVLDRAVHRLSEGDFDARIRISGNDEVAKLSAAFNDMAERIAQYRKSSIGELLEANSRLESVMDSLADAVVVYAIDGTPVTYNEAAVRVLGTDGVALDGLPEALGDAVHEAFESVRRTGEPHEPVSLESAVELTGSPGPRWVLVSATPVRAPAGVLSGVTVALRDVTRSRRIEGFKGDLVAAAAHELRTPLTSLHMAVHLCLEGAAGPLTDRQQDLLTAAREDCERLQSVIEELLEMARLESGAAQLERGVVNVGELVREAASRHEARAAQRGKSLEVLAGDSLLTMEADFGRLTHVLDNLIENALLHAGEGGHVAVGFEASDGAVRIFVDDNGPGVPADLRERIFAKFFRVPGTEKQGSGLGLSIVQDIVRAHGGEVGVEPSPLGGARFWFSIPVRPSPSNPRELPAPSS